MTPLSDLVETALKRFNGVAINAAKTLESEFYTRADVFDLEKSRIFQDAWHFTCRIEDIEKPGDYACDEYLGQRIFVLHGSDGKVRAFGNVCRHRWATLLEGNGSLGEGRGLIVCPYHRWCYNYKGELIGAPEANDLEKFQTDTQGLHRLGCVVWNGFVFVNLSKDNADFYEQFGGYTDLVEPYHGDLRCVRRTRYMVKANWKTYVEVDMETYHTPSVHPGSIGVQEVDAVTPKGNYIGVYHKNENTIALPPGLRETGFEKIDGLSGSQAEGTYFMVMLPSLFIVNTLDSMWWIQKVPVSHDTTDVRCGFAFPEKTLRRDDFEEVAQKYYDRWDTVIEEDNWIVERQFDGLKSQQFATLGRFVTNEQVVFDFDKWLLERLA